MWRYLSFVSVKGKGVDMNDDLLSKPKTISLLSLVQFLGKNNEMSAVVINLLIAAPISNECGQHL